MKSALRRGFFLLAAMLLLTVSALADTGPKPQLTVKVVNAPSEPYYLDILAPGTLSDPADPPEDDPLYDTLLQAVPEGWHACVAQGTGGAPIWGDLTGTETGGAYLHVFRYYGTPVTFRILMVTQSGQVFCSGSLTRSALQSTVTVDWAGGTVTQPPAWRAYLLQFLCTLLPTLLIEGALLLLFGYRNRQSFLAFLLINLVTQGAFSAYLAFTITQHGVSAWSLLLYVPAEFVITAAESLLDLRFLRGHSKRRAVCYAVTANLCSASLGLLLIDPLWRWIVTLS